MAADLALVLVDDRTRLIFDVALKKVRKTTLSDKADPSAVLTRMIMQPQSASASTKNGRLSKPLPTMSRSTHTHTQSLAHLYIPNISPNTNALPDGFASTVAQN